MFDPVEFIPEPYDGSATVRDAAPSYVRKSAGDFHDEPAQLTNRQANFYRNLIGLALVVGSSRLPVDFITADGRRMYLDRGCIKIAEHAGFIEPLENDSGGTVGTIALRWRARVSPEEA